MRFLLLVTFILSGGVFAQDYIQGEDMIYEDPGYVEESSSFAQERDPAGYEDYPLQDDLYDRQEEEYVEDEALFDESEDAYYAEEELLSP